MTNQRIVYLDVLRFIACIMVIIMHSPLPGSNAESHGPFLVLNSYLTTPCVPLFFMVSGALLLPCRENILATSYLSRRIGKIASPTIVFSLFYIFLGRDDNWLASIMSIPFSAQGHGVLWFVYSLLGLYMLVPIISPWVRQVSKKELEFYLLLWFITLCYPYISKFLYINNSATSVLYYFYGYLGYFILGYYLNRYTVSFRWLFLLTLLMLPLPLINKVSGWNLDFYSAFWYLSAPVAIMASAWFVLIKNFWNFHFFDKILSTMSDLSIGIYLIHIFVMRTILWNCSAVLNIQNYYIQTIVIVILTYIVSVIICKIISYLPFSQYIIGYSSLINRK